MALVMHSNLQNSSSIRLALSLQNHSSKNTNRHLIIDPKKKKKSKITQKSFQNHMQDGWILHYCKFHKSILIFESTTQPNIPS
jgi:hypothetical protein